MQKKLTVLFAFAIFVLLVGWAITPLQAHHCKGGHFFEGCVPGGGPGDDGGAGGKATSLIITFDDDGGNNLLSDGVDGGSYIDKVGVNASADGHITLALGKGNNDRQVRLNISCAKIDFVDEDLDDIDECTQLQNLNGLFPVEGQVAVRVNPYKVNCPTNGDECPDVFTMGTGEENSELMSIQVSFNEGLHIDVDSDIGGATAFDPGHCLSLLTEAQRTAFLGAECSNDPPSECNVTVTATHVGNDGKNDAWTVDAVGVTALICQIGNPGDQFVIGQTTLTFRFEAVKK